MSTIDDDEARLEDERLAANVCIRPWPGRHCTRHYDHTGDCDLARNPTPADEAAWKDSA